MDGDLPPYEPTQPIPSDVDGEGDEEESSSSSNGDDSGGEELVLRMSAAAGKRPLGGVMLNDDQASDGQARRLPANQVDLDMYLSTFDITEEQQIALCRTYANYLSAKRRPKEYRKRVKKE